MNRINLGPADTMPVNSVRQVVLDTGLPVALYRLPDGYFATDDVCSHGEASLAEGEIEDGEIVCPFHLIRMGFRTRGFATRLGVSAVGHFATVFAALMFGLRIVNDLLHPLHIDWRLVIDEFAS